MKKHYKITACGSALRNAVKTVFSFETMGKAAPRFSAVCINATGDKLDAVYSDPDLTASYSVEAAGKGRVFLPAKLLIGILAAADSEPVTLDWSRGDSHVAISYGEITARIVPLPAADEPMPVVIDRGGNTPPIALAQGALAHALALAVPFMSREDTRYYLCGAAFDVVDNVMRVVATDGHRLGFRATHLVGDHPDMPVRIVPANVLRRIRGLAGAHEASIRFAEDRARFSIGPLYVATKLIDGTFPDWRRVVPPHGRTDRVAVIPSAEVLRFLKAAKTLGRGPAAIIAMGDEGKPVLRVKSADDGGEISTTVALGQVAKWGDAIGVNPQYLAEIFRALNSRQVRIEASDPGSPIRIADHEATSSADFAVLMPMRI